MKSHRSRTVLTCTAALATLALLPSPGHAEAKRWQDVPVPELRSFDIPSPARHELPNGLVVFLMEDHELPLIDLSATVRTGGRYVPADRTGLDEVFGETWRTGGTKSRTGDQLDDELEARAAEVESSMGDESARLHMNCLAQDFDAVLATFVDVLQNPAFTEDKIGIAKRQVQTSISRRNDDPSGIIYREAAKLGYGADSPYARVPEYATVDAITRQDLVQWHATYVHPDRTIIGVVGDFEPAAMLAKITKALGGWPRGPKVETPAVPYREEAAPGVFFIEKEDVTQAQIVMVHKGIRRDDPDYHAVEVLNEILSGGFTSRLFNGIRSKRGLAYSVFGGVYSSYDHPGLTIMGMGTKNASVAAGVDAFYEELAGILGGVPVTDEELRTAKDSILNSFVFKVDSRQKVLGQQVTYAYYGYPADFLQRYQAGIQKVTKEEVMRVAKTHIHKEDLALLVLGKSAEFDRPLSTFGKVTSVDIAIPEPGATGKPAAAADPAAEAKGREVLARLVESYGGEAKLAGVKDVMMSGSIKMVTPMGEVNARFKATQAGMDTARQEIDMGGGQQMVVVVSPAGAFMTAGGQTQDMPGSEREEMKKESRRNPLYIAAGVSGGKVRALHAGREKVGNVETDAIDVEHEGVRVRLWVDDEGRVVRASSQGMGPEGPAETVADYGDFRKVSGMWMPFSEKNSRGGKPSQSVVVEEMQVNVGLDPALLQRP